ncbi:CotS family spore coat protein [Clostridium sp. MB40-C1]|uniref:CotS family spore coat protein n=1 Tax=Clostridium sp. MB40-C1 TaxID=3070996 RepID=UPI0027E196EB|nr:CotS family spore coat protein [Clostridium sp. MB40-C1]WMJ82299.1 CotS family spore coat protein [Clostridium sp. MB40-C1]
MPNAAKSYNLNLLSEENVKRCVLPHYNLEDAKIESIKFKDTDKQRAVYKIEHSNKTYCLKKVYFGKEDLLFVYSAIEWLYRHGLNVPRILPSKYNGRFVEYERMLFILTPWIEGEKCNYDLNLHLNKTCSTLATFHNQCNNFIPIHGSSSRKGCNNLYESINKHFQQLLIHSNMAFKYKDNFSKIYLKNFNKAIYLAKKSVEALSKVNPANLTVSLCHMDYVNKNLIFDFNSNIWIIDFDKCRMDYVAYDLSYFFRRLLKREKTNWDINTAIFCLKSYEKIRPLNMDEYNYLLGYLTFPQKYWKISKDYYRNIRKCNKKAFRDILLSSCKSFDAQIKFNHDFNSYINKNVSTN